MTVISWVSLEENVFGIVNQNTRLFFLIFHLVDINHILYHTLQVQSIRKYFCSGDLLPRDITC